ncbi:MAG: heavy metal translocating P-type ATPase [Frisingicoccus sp.]|uniref:heavy metal translocating P-type ATPase n=2 Tax=Frisingicoccus sp. TaxID=1918627 RepID=UPI002A8066BB|nr:heavy metal translocating P-type ATPase [Frisingicoccus sp.]MDY4834009.1 heavy metal translocating P-type ATPase [Frisingicoccus sp.]
MTKKQKNMLARIIIAALIFVPLFIAEHMGKLEFNFRLPLAFLLFLIPYLIVGWDILYRAVRNIRNGQIFDENFLMCIATFGAFAVQEHEEAVAVMLFYQVGELFQNYAVNRSRQSISDLMNIYPEYANIEVNGELEQVDPDDVEIGSTIVIKPGERIPLDGIVLSGTSFVDTSALTGESVPRKVSEGEEIISGCVNGNGLLKVRVTKEFDDSTVSKILELVENASSKKAKVENFITKFARYYTPVVVIGAAALAVIPPIVFGGGWQDWMLRACSFLVISCPCALVISVPLGFFGGIGAASRIGVLVKGSNYLEALAKMDTIVFDKTGTLTKGEFKVNGIYPVSMTDNELIEMAALAECYSEHPIGAALRQAYGKPVQTERVTDVKEIAGQGIEALIDGHKVLAGNAKLMNAYAVDFTENKEIGTIVYVAVDHVYAGSVLISDEIKPGAKEALAALKASGVKKSVMLTGDKKDVGQAVAKELGIDTLFADLLPADKVTKVEELLNALSDKEKLAFVGDGINDAPVLSRADIGIAMGSMGSDAAIEAADIVLMDDDPLKIAAVIRIARNTLGIVTQNIIFALGVKGIILILGAMGIANMWAAVFADVGVAVLAILNSMRVIKMK